MNRRDFLMAATVVIALLSVAALNFSHIAYPSSTQSPTFATAPVGSKIDINQTANGYNISNISTTNPFTVTLNGSVFVGYISYITPTSAGLVFNHSVYTLSPNRSTQVRRTIDHAFYAMLTNLSAHTNEPTVNIALYSMASQPPPTINRTYNLSANVPLRINITNTTAYVTLNSSVQTMARLDVENLTGISESLPPGTNPILVLNLSVFSNSDVAVMLSVRYSCTTLSSTLMPYVLLGKGNWTKINPFSVNIGACTATFATPQQSISGLFQQQALAATIGSTQTTTIIPTTVVAATAIQNPQQSSTHELEATVLVIVILVIVVIMYSAGRHKKPAKQKAKGAKQ